MAEGSFVRVFHEDLREHHAEVWLDARTLGTFVQLLARADKLWPTPADLPRRISRAALDMLVKSKLVVLLSDHCYRIRGLDVMRQARSQAASKAADGRWHPEGNAEGNAPRNAEGNADAFPRARGRSGLPWSESSSSVEDGTLRARGPLVLPVKGMDGSVSEVSISDDPIPASVRRLQKLAADLTGQPFIPPSGGLMKKAITEQLPHGLTRVESAWRKIAAQIKAAGTSSPTLRQLVLGADDILNPIPQANEKAQRTEEMQADFDRRVERTKAYIANLKEVTE